MTFLARKLYNVFMNDAKEVPAHFPVCHDALTCTNQPTRRHVHISTVDSTETSVMETVMKMNLRNHAY